MGSTETLAHFKAQTLRGQSACPSTNCQFSISLQSSRSLQPRAEVSQMCFSITSEPAEQLSRSTRAGRKHLHYSQLPGKMNHVISFWLERRMQLPSLFFTGGERGQGLRQSLTSNYFNLHVPTKGQAQMWERMVTTVFYVVTPRYQEYFCVAQNSTGKK